MPKSSEPTLIENATKPSEKRGLSSVSKSLAVLEYLIESGEAGVSEIARHVGVTVGTSHRLVATLVLTGWAEQNTDNRRYRPSQKVVRLAHKIRKTISARDIAHEALERLVRAMHETGNIGVFSDRRVLYVDKVTSDQPFGIEARIGTRLPAYCTALGKVLVAGMDDEGVEQYLALLKEWRKERHRPAPPTPTEFRAVLAKSASSATRSTTASTSPTSTASLRRSTAPAATSSPR